MTQITMTEPSLWHAELERFRTFKTTFLLEGNIYDLHTYPNPEDQSIHLFKLDQYLHTYLTQVGYSIVIFYNHIDGFTNEFDESHLHRFLAITGGDGKATLPRATEMVRKAMENREQPLVVILNYASRYILSPNQLTDEELKSYSRLFLATMKPREVRVPEGNGFLRHLLFILSNKTNDLPAWYYMDNPYVKTLHIPKPDSQTRRWFIDSQLRFFLQQDLLDPSELEKQKQRFVDLTDGLTNIELNGLKILCRQEQIPIERIDEALTLFKYGRKHNPWNDVDHGKLKDAASSIKKRVKGQEASIIQTLDIIKRSVSGLSGLQHSSRGSKPKGILFFAGPTGTGKTELAKTIAELLFGDEQACIRFDMSEYQQSHSDQKLLGAPPGYVGYESGGQLTNAIKRKPFSILLFDEIEKAHPSILDKFLQILEDGRMTDSQGETVYFSESIIVFTSNLGIYRTDEHGQKVHNVTPDMDYPLVKEKVKQAIKDYFHLELGRPEILNRIGNNIVVFDYIREEVARDILQAQLERITKNLLQQKQIEVVIGPQAYAYLQNKALENLDNGGRGIGNMVESHFINPLARYLFDEDVKAPCRLIIDRIFEEQDISQMEGRTEYV